MTLTEQRADAVKKLAAARQLVELLTDRIEDIDRQLADEETEEQWIERWLRYAENPTMAI